MQCIKTEMDRLKSRVKDRIILSNIKIWFAPFYDLNSGKINSTEVEMLAKRLAGDLQAPAVKVASILTELQHEALTKIQNFNPFEKSVNFNGYEKQYECQGHFHLFEPAVIDNCYNNIRFFMVNKLVYHPSVQKPKKPASKTGRICTNYSDDHCASQQCDKKMKKTECFSCGPKCENQSISKNAFMDSAWFKIRRTDDKGLCLFLDKDVSKKTLLLEYLGEVIPADLYKQREKLSESYYGFQLKKDLVIDARQYGNYARFISHSCSPNCRAEKWMVANEKRVVIRAIKDIKRGEELSYDYGEDFCSTRSFECCCKAANCRGMVGGNFATRPEVHKCLVQGCSKAYLDRASLKTHMGHSHKADYLRTCIVCGTLFSSDWAAQQHMNNQHSVTDDIVDSSYCEELKQWANSVTVKKT